MRRSITMLVIFAVTALSACTSADASGKNTICGIVDSVSRDTMTVLKNKQAYEVHVVHFSDGRQMRTLDIPSTQLIKGNSYLFPTSGRQNSEVQMTYYQLNGQTIKVTSCDSLPAQTPKK